MLLYSLGNVPVLGLLLGRAIAIHTAGRMQYNMLDNSCQTGGRNRIALEARNFIDYYSSQSYHDATENIDAELTIRFASKERNPKGTTTMGQRIFEAIRKKVQNEPFAKKMGLTLEALDEGYSLVNMDLTPDMENIFGMAHGGAIFSLIDEAFETASNSHGTMAVALNMNTTYLAPPSSGDRLTAEAKEVNKTNRTANYYITVKNQEGKLLATCQALVYRKKESLPFIAGEG
jgi:acyl-CoA thioesterase